MPGRGCRADIYQVKRQLLELTAALDPGSPVPPERELARSYGTSRTTVRQALAELVIEGRLLRMQQQRHADVHPSSRASLGSASTVSIVSCASASWTP